MWSSCYAFAIVPRSPTLSEILFERDDKKQGSCPLSRINRYRLLVGDHVLSQSLATLMVTPQGWRLLALFAWACDQQNQKPTSELFRYFYQLTKNHGSKGCFYTFSRHAQESIPSIFARGVELADEKGVGSLNGSSTISKLTH